jgi:hypothetical protein
MKLLLFAVCAAMILVCGCISVERGTLKTEPTESPFTDLSGYVSGNPTLTLTDPNRIPIIGAVFPKDKEEADRVLAQAPVGAAPEKAKRLIVYTASFLLSVYDRDASAKKIIELAQKAGGFVSSQTNETVIVRVPADKFKKITEALPNIGRVIQKNIEASDVTEQCSDLELRLSAKKKYLASLQELLTKAENAKTMLEIQKEIGAVVEEIEVLEGKLRYLADRVAYSTIAVTLQLATAETYRAFRLPFDWIESLGIEHLVAAGGGAR